MRRALRQSVRVRFDFRCGYCGVSETNIGAEMTVDHFLPRIHGQDDSLDNLVYCCHACNEFKGDYWRTEPDLRLLHPLLDDLTLHWHEQDDGTLFALTERGANHLQILRLNRPELIAYRLEQKEILLLRQLNQKLRQQLQEAQQTTRHLESELERSV
ncbi:MAG TPA: HNH endonuclease signature motif containing protein [Chthonomonadaceae bacterium]|nr:HNH endonuclease signature motif containing protein [Chthonomonadaceae bacterium]